MTDDEIIQVVTAHRDGKVIQWMKNGEWIDCSCPVWSFAVDDYRVKPEPRVIWVNEYHNNRMGIAHDTKECAVASRESGVRRVAVKFIEVVEQSTTDLGQPGEQKQEDLSDQKAKLK